MKERAKERRGVTITFKLLSLFVNHISIHSSFSVTFLADVLGVASKVTVKEGENVTLPCSTSLQGGVLYKTTWYKGTQKVMVIMPAGIPGNPPSIYKYSQRKNAYTLVGRQSILLTGVDRYDHGNYSCTALYSDENFQHKNIQKDVILLVKGEIMKLFLNKRLQRNLSLRTPL